MQTPREPETALLLQVVLDELVGRAPAGRRPNPPRRRYALDVRSPDPDARRLPGDGDEDDARYWRDLGDYAEERGALDEAAASRLEPGTVVRVRAGTRAETTWLGFVAADGQVVPARPLPRRRPRGVRTWVDAWYGPLAEGPWMLRQCRHLADRNGVKTLTLAACACAATGALPIGGAGATMRLALRWAESWARGGSMKAEALEYAFDVETAIEPLRGSDRIAATGVLSAVSMPHYTGGPGAEMMAENAAASAAASRRELDGRPTADRSFERELAEVVRGFISLGMALSAPS